MLKLDNIELETEVDRPSITPNIRPVILQVDLVGFVISTAGPGTFSRKDISDCIEQVNVLFTLLIFFYKAERTFYSKQNIQG